MSNKARSSTESYSRVILHNSSTVVDDTLSYPSVNEVISSENVRFKGIGNVSHMSTRILHAGNVHTFYGGNSGTSDVWRSTPCAFGVGVLDSLPTEGVDLDALRREAFAAMKPSMESGFSSVNFLLELADLKTLFRLWDPSKNYLRNIAAGNLSYHYGWKQAVRDAKDIYQRLRNFEEKLNSFIKNEGAPQKRHFRKSVATSAADVEAPIHLWGNDRVKYVYTYNTPTTYTATMRYRYYLPDISRDALRVRALADHWGLKVNASVIWNAIPLSFVVDWFVRVGDFLSQFDNNYIEPDVQILDFCESVKRNITTKVYCRRNVANPNNSAWCLSHTVQHRSYNRNRAYPNLSGWIPVETDQGGWDITRYSLAASLFIVRW